MPLINRILPVAPFATLDDYLAAGGGRALEAARRVEPDALIGEGRRTKQPDWTHDAPWSGSYPADELGDHTSRHDID